MLSEHKGEMIFIGIAMTLYLVMAAFDASQKFVYWQFYLDCLDSSLLGNFLKVWMMNRQAMKK